MEQGSSAWTQWRDEGEGSSDAPVIMAVEGAYKTRYQLYLEKTKQAPPKSEKELKSKQFIFDKGHRIEEMVRGRYELKEDVRYTPELFQRSDKPYMKASFDLANKELRKGKEVKYVSLEEFDAGVCPVRYMPQIKWQYLVSDFLEITLILATDYMWTDETKTEKVKIPSREGFRTKEVHTPLDIDYCVILFDAGVDFWENNVMKKIAPELSDKDAIAIKDKELHKKLKRYAAIEKRLDKVSAIEKERKKLIDEIFRHEEIKHPIMSYGKMKVKLVKTKGSIEYKNIPAVKAMKEDELESFRGATTFKRSILCS